MQPKAFTFISLADLKTRADGDTLILEVGPRLADKNTLFAWFANHLEFPYYFNENWDSFDECINDLGWLGNRKVFLFHGELPLGSSVPDRQFYLSILADVICEGSGVPELLVAFDPSLEPELRFFHTGQG